MTLLLWFTRLKGLKESKKRPTPKMFFFNFQSWFVWGFFIKFFGGLGLWCLNPLSTIFRLYRGSQLEETEVHVENHRPAASHLQTLSHNVVSSTRHLIGIRTYTISGDRYWLHSVVVNPTTIRSRPLHPLNSSEIFLYEVCQQIWCVTYHLWYMSGQQDKINSQKNLSLICMD